MTNEQKNQIAVLRAQGLGYKKVAQVLNLSVNTVKSFCKRSQIFEPDRALPAVEPSDGFCRQCGAPLMQQDGKKKIRFCSDGCRQKWWNAHPEKVNRRAAALYAYTCPSCGKHFSVYGNSHRKYCCHACYVADRFGDGNI